MSKKSKWQEVGESGHVKVLFVKSLNLTKLQAIKKKERKKKKKKLLECLEPKQDMIWQDF
jgi:hypothetical protein